jgi:hypothetical protein
MFVRRLLCNLQIHINGSSSVEKEMLNNENLWGAEVTKEFPYLY